MWTGFDYKGEPTPYAWPNINSQHPGGPRTKFSQTHTRLSTQAHTQAHTCAHRTIQYYYHARRRRVCMIVFERHHQVLPVLDILELLTLQDSRRTTFTIIKHAGLETRLATGLVRLYCTSCHTGTGMRTPSAATATPPFQGPCGHIPTQTRLSCGSMATVLVARS